MIKQQLDQFITTENFKQWLQQAPDEAVQVFIEGTPNYTPLQYAVHKKQIEAAILLIEDNRIDLNHICEYGYTAAEICASMQLYSVLEQLLLRPHIDYSGVVSACILYGGSIETLNALLTQKPELKSTLTTTITRNTRVIASPLQTVFSHKCQLEITQWLIAQIDAPFADFAQIAPILVKFIENAPSDRVHTLLEFCIEQGLDINQTFLHKICNRDHEIIFQTETLITQFIKEIFWGGHLRSQQVCAIDVATATNLIKLMSVNGLMLPDQENQTPLMLTCKHGSQEISLAIYKKIYAEISLLEALRIGHHCSLNTVIAMFEWYVSQQFSSIHNKTNTRELSNIMQTELEYWLKTVYPEIPTCYIGLEPLTGRIYSIKDSGLFISHESFYDVITKKSSHPISHLPLNEKNTIELDETIRIRIVKATMLCLSLAYASVHTDTSQAEANPLLEHVYHLLDENEDHELQTHFNSLKLKVLQSNEKASHP